ncbi:MAG: NAD-dependent epimerase/dehydratase, dTDP-glucose 4,6-dehydratase [Candidatus Peregrinibacteria bacterium GW2011_GWF2_43_17]|nr:MAG: NAD-dependent epimerase/dehydratase, dTDP-glucose 4,6-dehydratase [Candidatus Peregrinibacteria bacterium GW2011_GWF2_43_17]KKT19652.1 MAG: NAD-dependent epimerase/dehydratase [Candidatus Peregrinibacteria bacterium GW2011_GWA2_43_8]
MSILITGGAGFIGSHLCERLLKTGHKVICVDNFITGDHSNIDHLMKDPNFRLIEHDITNPILGEELDLEDVTEIFNLACPASPIDYQKIPLETLWVSAAGTKNMLDLAVKLKARFLQASTSEVYGDPLEHPQKESYFGNVNCLGPRSCYDEGKRFGESLITNYSHKYGLDTKIVRIFNTYGPKMRAHDGRVIPNFITQALSGKSITIYGDGYQTRSFCYVDDMVDGILALMATKDFKGPVNIGNPEEYSIKALAEKIVELTDSKSKIVYKNLPQDDPKVRRPDITLAKKTLGFEPKIKFEHGLKKTIEWFKNIS